MLGIENYKLFLITVSFFIIAPGVDTVFVLNKSISEGKEAGLFATLGINSGILIHTLFAALGLSMLIAQSAIAFSIIKYLGAIYLIYIGIRALISKDTHSGFETIETSRKTNFENFRIGFITNVLNPKVALFFLSFFPQFINPSDINSFLPFVVLGLTYAFIGLIWFFILSYFSASFSNKLKTNSKFKYYLDKLSGMIYILLGIKIALTRK